MDSDVYSDLHMIRDMTAVMKVLLEALTPQEEEGVAESVIGEAGEQMDDYRG